MAADIIQFVDAISSTPTVLLDLNDETSLRTRIVSAPPPRLRRTTTQNTMSDGEYTSSSTYGGRVLTLDIDILTDTQDANATLIQSAVRLLDRAESFIRYRPVGLTRYGFLRVTRSDIAGLVDVIAAKTYRQVTVELACDPFMLGLRETITVGTVNNDPAAANGCYFDVSTVKGDVAAPMVLVDTGTLKPNMLLAVTQGANATDFPTVIQGESFNIEDADTSNPGGAADAAMSGSGTTNYLRTTFTTVQTMLLRATADASTSAAKRALRGTQRALLTVRRSEAVANIAVQTLRTVNDASVSSDDIVIPKTTNRQIVDLGFVTFGLGRAISPSMIPGTGLSLKASRAVAAGNLQWDCLQYIPADYATCILSGLSAGFLAQDVVFDGEHEQVQAVTTGTSIFDVAGTAETRLAPFSGAIPRLQPGVTNRFFYLKWDAATNLVDKTVTGSVTIYYLPHYMHVPTATT